MRDAPGDGEADLRDDRVARRLHRGRERPVRLGDAERRGARVRQRPRAADRHLPLRAPDVRDDGLLGESARPRSGVSRLPGLRRAMAGGRQDRVLPDALGDGECEDADRARVRHRGGSPAEGLGGARHLGGRTRTSPHTRSGRGWSTSITSSSRLSWSAVASDRFPNVRLDLDLVDERRFDNGVVYLHYRTRPAAS